MNIYTYIYFLALDFLQEKFLKEFNILVYLDGLQFDIELLPEIVIEALQCCYHQAYHLKFYFKWPLIILTLASLLSWLNTFQTYFF